MTRPHSIVLALLLLSVCRSTPLAQKPLRQFIFFSQEREAIRDPAFYQNKDIAGAQITYPWKKLEPQKGRYDFTEIEEDLQFLRAQGKNLFIQIQDVTFDSASVALPGYMLEDSVYHGGVSAQYEFDTSGRSYITGWVARRWEKSVSDRFHQLLSRLAEQFDGRIEGINLPETAVDFPEQNGLSPAGFSRLKYMEAIEENMLLLKTRFTKSRAIQYANFMPGDSIDDLASIYAFARKIRLGMGGPDIKVWRKMQMENSYPLIRAMAGIAATGVAVQEGNYSLINPKTGKQVSILEIYDFAKNYLKLDYIFWCREEPYYTMQLLPFLRSMRK